MYRVVLSSHCIMVERRAGRPSSCPYVTASCVLVPLCMKGQCRDNKSNIQMSRRLTRCSEEVKRLIDICVSLAHFLDVGQKNSDVNE